MIQIVLSVLLAAVAMNSAAQSKDEIAQLAQRMEGTIYVIPHRESADGLLTACGLEFGAMKRDFSTMKGAPVKIVGSFYLRTNAKTGIAYMLKLGVFDGFDYKDGIAPSNAFISAPGGKIPKKAIRMVAENKSFALFVGAFDDDVTAAYAGIAEKSQLVVGFNRKPGQQDVTFRLDLTVADTEMGADGNVVRKNSDEPVRSFLACSGDLVETVRAAMK